MFRSRISRMKGHMRPFCLGVTALWFARVVTPF